LLGCKHTQPLEQSRLRVPDGFSISVFAKAPHARMMAFSPGGALLVTSTNDGKVLALPDYKFAGAAEKSVTVLQDLNAPHGIAFHNG
jgi:glucose/arabinose dehydrogenase